MLGSRQHYDFLYRTGPMGWSQALRTAAIGTSLGSIGVHRSPELARRQAQLARNTPMLESFIGHLSEALTSLQDVRSAAW